VIYFGKIFFRDPSSTLALLKVQKIVSFPYTLLKFRYQTKFSSPEDGLLAWGLRNPDMTFLRREIRAILYKYIQNGDATVEFD
jgi:hypothetical protein